MFAVAGAGTSITFTANALFYNLSIKDMKCDV
jgi:hypothetical protein